MTIKKLKYLHILFAAAVLMPLPAASAEWKPSGTMTVIVASGAGGAYDVLQRAMGKLWEKHFGVKMIVQNMKAAGGSLGLDRVAKGKPDGRTIGFMSRGPYLGELLTNNFPWKIGDVPLILAAKTPPYVINVSAKSPYKTWDDVRKANKPLNLGVASQLTTELVIIKDLLDAGRKVNTGSMKTTEIITSLIAGDLDLWTAVSSATVMDPYEAGDVRPLVTLDTERAEHLPDVPMLTEVGMPAEWKAVASYRIWFAPIGTPPEIVDGVAKRLTALLNDPEIKDWAKKNGFVHGLVSAAETKAAQEGLHKILKDNWDIYKKYGG